jgi:hypothetical protein
MGQKIWSGLSDIVRGRRQPAPPCVRSEAIDILSDCFFAATVILYTFVHRGKGWQHVSRTSRARSNTRHASLVNLRDRTNYNVYPSDFTAVDHPLVSGPHSNDMAPASWHVPAERQRLRKHNAMPAPSSLQIRVLVLRYVEEVRQQTLLLVWMPSPADGKIAVLLLRT